MKKYDAIYFDFDGVIMDSMPVRDKGFREVLTSFPKEDVNALIRYHNENGGLSRYHKFRYFFKHFQNKELSDTELNELANSFSKIMKRELINPDYLIQDTFGFIKRNFEKVPMLIISGSDQAELRYLCHELRIDIYFKKILGSPISKRENIKRLMAERNDLNPVYIGDAQNDHEASLINGIDFIGYNNIDLREKGSFYVANSDDWNILESYLKK